MELGRVDIGEAVLWISREVMARRDRVGGIRKVDGKR